MQAQVAAEAARGQAEKIAEFLSETLAGAAPSVALGRDTTMLKDLMDAAAARIEKGDMKSAPEAELRLRGTIGTAYLDLAAFDAADQMLRPALTLARSLHPGDHLTTAEAIGNMSSLLYNRRELEKSLPLAREALDMTRRLLPGDHKLVASALHDLAMTHRARNELTQAETLMLEALEVNRRLSPAGSPEVASCLTNLAGIRQQNRENETVEPLCREALEMFRRLYPADHPQVAYGAHNLASALEGRGDLAGAALLLHEALDICERIYPAEHPIVYYRLQVWLRVAIATDGLGEAESLILQRYLRLRERPPGTNWLTHVQTIQAIERVVRLYEAKGNEAEAAAWRSKLEAA